MSSDAAQQARNPPAAQPLPLVQVPAPPPVVRTLNLENYIDQIHPIQPLALDPNSTVRQQLDRVNQANTAEWTAMRGVIAIGRLYVPLKMEYDREDDGIQVQLAAHQDRHRLLVGQEVMGAGACEAVARKVRTYLRPLGVRATGLRNILGNGHTLTGNHAYNFIDPPNPQNANPPPQRVIVDATWKQFGNLLGIPGHTLQASSPVLIGTGAEISAYLTQRAGNTANAANIAALVAFYG